MVEIDKNFEEVLDKATNTGEKIVTIECPCCHKIFYVTEKEASFEVINRNEETDFGIDLKKFSGKQLGRKCPFCGFSGTISPSNFLNLGR